jgi:hypothetical protein
VRAAERWKQTKLKAMNTRVLKKNPRLFLNGKNGAIAGIFRPKQLLASHRTPFLIQKT